MKRRLAPLARWAMALLMSSAGVGVSATGATAETLHEAVDYALATNPELRALAANREAIDMELNAARGLRLPSLDISANGARHETRSRDGTTLIKSSDHYWERGAGFTLVQRLFDGFEARHEIARQTSRVESARNRVADTANSIALRVVQAYLEVQRAQRVRTAARGNLDALVEIQRRVKSRVEGGRGNAAEDSEAAARVENGRALLAEAEGRVREAEALYFAIVGHEPRGLQAVDAPRQALPGSLDSALARSRDAAPSILATIADTQAAEAAIGGAYARFSPYVNLEVAGDRAFGGPAYGSTYSSDLSAMLVVRMNVFNGGIDKARIYEYAARKEEARNIALNTARSVEREVRVSWSTLSAAEARRSALARQLKQNQKTRRIYNEQFEVGQRRLLDLLDIQTETFVAEATLATEELSARYHVYRVLAAMGSIVDVMGRQMPVEAVRPPAASLIEGWRNIKIERPAIHPEVFGRGQSERTAAAK